MYKIFKEDKKNLSLMKRSLQVFESGSLQLKLHTCIFFRKI